MFLSDDAKHYLSSDEAFDSLLPVHIRQLSGIHWTPLNVAFAAARFLAPDAAARVIDIGAGIGKFCIAGCCATDGSFTGIDQRKNFVTIGNKVVRKLGVSRAELIHGNFMDIQLTA